MKKSTNKAAVCLQAGLTLVPYRAYNERGQLTWFSKWVRLQPGQTVAQAAMRLSVPPPQPTLTPAQQVQVKRLLEEMGLRYGYAKTKAGQE